MRFLGHEPAHTTRHADQLICERSQHVVQPVGVSDNIRIDNDDVLKRAIQSANRLDERTHSQTARRTLVLQDFELDHFACGCFDESLR